jgi:hypothetical protein
MPQESVVHMQPTPKSSSTGLGHAAVEGKSMAQAGLVHKETAVKSAAGTNKSLIIVNPFFLLRMCS